MLIEIKAIILKSVKVFINEYFFICTLPFISSL
jgi:hypothetical protein